MDIHDSLEQAIGILENGRPRAFGGGVVVDRERLLQLLQNARATLPDEILAAASLLAQRNQLISAAEAEAEQVRAAAVADAESLREAAEAERARLVAEHEVLREAQAQADSIIATAQQRAEAMRDEVDAYVDAKLAAIAGTLSSALEVVEGGRRKVGQDRQAAAAR